ncbi:papain-like cysteine protease family protein [Pseudomonas sp.]|uniref:papain-like cysteine protease family protein n=1 Tax=Pseudomonas sp. TaxID=306 RepID=UPI0025CF6877|nr:papain-like cysteine protease family protein [Pseudomonas sp.]
MTVQALFLASWERSDGAWIARHGLTAAQYQATFEQNAAQGFRLRAVSGYSVNGTPAFTAIWDKTGGPAWAARHGLTGAQYQQAFDQFAQQGYRLKMVSGYGVGAGANFAAVWDQSSGPAWTARHGLSSTQYQQAFDQLAGQGYRLRWVSVYTESGQVRYAGVWDKSSSTSWVARHGLEEAAFRAAAQSYGAQGYDLVCGNAATEGGKDYYAALWEKTPATSVMHHGMTASTYQIKFDDLSAQGWRPAFVAGYAGEDPVDVVLRFPIQRQLQGQWCWAAVAASVSRYYRPGTTWTQCSVADRQWGRTDCCGTGATGACNNPSILQTALTNVGHLNRQTAVQESLQTVENEVVAGRPLCIRIAWAGGGGHFVVASGIEDEDFVWVSDPGGGTTALVAYDTLRSAYAGSGSWTHSYFTRA